MRPGLAKTVETWPLAESNDPQWRILRHYNTKVNYTIEILSINLVQLGNLKIDCKPL